MHMISKMLGLLGAASLLAGSGAAAAQSAAPLSVAQSPAARSGAEVSNANAITGDAKWVVGAIALALLIWGAIELLGDDDEAFPNSP
jgi:hypothetical protein